MFKSIKKTFSNLNKKVVVASIVVGTPIVSMASGVVDTAFGTTGATTNVIKTIIAGSTLVSTLVQSAIILGILFSIFQIGKELLGEGGQGGKALWGKIGAMLAFAVLYYYLFMV